MYGYSSKTRLDYYTPWKLVIVVLLSCVMALLLTIYAFAQQGMIEVGSIKSDRRAVEFSAKLLPENRFLSIEASANGTAVLAFNIEREVSANVTSMVAHTEHTYSLSCVPVCEPATVLYMPFIDGQRYSISIDLVQPLSTEFRLSYVSAQYTSAELTFKSCLFVFSTLFLVVYLAAYLRVPADLRKFEGKLLIFLQVSLILYNDPWAYFVVYFPSTLTYSLSLLSCSQFVAGLFIFWMLVFQNHTGISGNPLVYSAEVGMVSLAYILGSILAVSTVAALSKDPTYRYTDSLLTDILVVAVVLLGSVCLFLLALLISGLFSCRKVVFRKRFVSIANMVAIVVTYAFMVAYFVAEDPGIISLVARIWMNFYVGLLGFLFTSRVEDGDELFTEVKELDRPEDIFDWKD